MSLVHTGRWTRTDLRDRGFRGTRTGGAGGEGDTSDEAEGKQSTTDLKLGTLTGRTLFFL